jgi:hypothetical protein
MPGGTADATVSLLLGGVIRTPVTHATGNLPRTPVKPKTLQQVLSRSEVHNIVLQDRLRCIAQGKSSANQSSVSKENPASATLSAPVTSLHKRHRRGVGAPTAAGNHAPAPPVGVHDCNACSGNESRRALIAAELLRIWSSTEADVLNFFEVCCFPLNVSRQQA